MSFLSSFPLDPVSNDYTWHLAVTSLFFNPEQLPRLIIIVFLNNDIFEDFKPVVLWDILQLDLPVFFVIRFKLNNFWQEYG